MHRQMIYVFPPPSLPWSCRTFLNLPGGCKYKIHNMRTLVMLQILYLHPPRKLQKLQQDTLIQNYKRDLTFWLLIHVLICALPLATDTLVSM